MMVASYLLGQKHYRIPYAKKKLISYLVLTTLVFFIHKGLVALYGNIIFSVASAGLLLLSFCWFVAIIEKKEFQQFPVIGKYFK